MIRILWATLVIGVMVVVHPLPSRAEPATLMNEPIRPIPPLAPLSPAMVDLGRTLFHDTRLSGDGTISCAHCHPLEKGGMDNLPHSFGIGGAEGKINTPTVYNAALNFRQFWNGRAATLEEQIDGPVQATDEMAADWAGVVARLRADRKMATTFERLFPDGVTAANIKRAIADFERTLLTHDSPFDRYLAGDPNALSPEQAEGYLLFKKYGCSSCHQGANVGGNLYEKLGIVRPYFTGDMVASEADMGRYAVTGEEDHRYEFKVPSLRNVALTAPYLHDGSVVDLENTVRIMAYYQIGRDIPDEEINLIVHFLGSLTGRHPELKP